MQSESPNLGDIEFTEAERYLIELRRQYDESLHCQEMGRRRLVSFTQLGTSREAWAESVKMSKKGSSDPHDDLPLQPFVIRIDPYFTGPDD
jgi:hypothetical protein